MSAAEKLKALDGATALEKYEIDLFAVLPQIVAVVEAAEDALGWGRFNDPDMEAWNSYERACAALAALDKALEHVSLEMK